MLTLKNIVKVYGEGETEVRALKGVSLNFRESEFVAILGPSGCGKTTMLNIVGGLDRYTEGDLIINGKSTKDFTDRDWDNYRNHSVGFIFQSYNLIPHQNVIKNVELALTLSGVGREERYERALAALEQVGLKDQAKKMPNQLSGGQMQRVAIARAIVNNPDIILADEPTGALDSETSVQVMEILKELSKTRLVVMVTHNGELADRYATRIINLFDGLVTSDTLPCTEEELTTERERVETAEAVTTKKGKGAKKASMSPLTAFSLSLNNLFTKKGRTILTALAGSVGIIGIALILSLSSGFNAYVQNIQRDTLANYPVTISSTNINTMGAAAFMGGFMGAENREGDEFPTDNKVSSHNVIADMVTNVAGMYETNDLTEFSAYLKDYTEKHDCSDIISAITYTYDYKLELYQDEAGEDGSHRRLYPLTVPKMEEVLEAPADRPLTSDEQATLNEYYKMFVQMLTAQSTFAEMIDNEKLIREQYEVLEGKLATEENEAVLVVDSYNQISDLALYSMSLMNDDDIRWIFYKMISTILGNEPTDEEIEAALGCRRSDIYYNGLDISDLLGLTYKVSVLPDKYKLAVGEDGNPLTYTSNYGEDKGKTGNFWTKKTNAEYQSYLTSSAEEVKIVGVVRLKKGVSAGCLTGTVCYSPKLSESVKSKILNSAIVKDHLEKIRLSSDLYFNVLGTQDNPGISASEYIDTGKKVGYFSNDKPFSIQIYPTSFEAKNDVIRIIDEFNAGVDEKKRIKYTDYMGLMMESITTIINAVTYVLIAFVSISLLVSSIMIGIITYISVLERTKEIGVLRSVGASKRDISRVFNAETFIIGLTAGILGILITLLLNIPINLIISSLSGLANVASLPVGGALILIAISVLLTVISGLIPSGFAAKRDPVVALRSE